jgi:hypothetical protein
VKSHETTSSENSSTSVSICQPQEQIANLIKSLSQTGPDFYRNGRLLHWLGVDSLQNIIKQNQSCIVVGDERGGKGCAATLCQDGADDNVLIMASPVDVDEIFARLWRWLDRPTPSIEHDNISTHINIPDSTCGKCELECELKKNPSLWEEPDKVSWVLGDKIDKCSMVKHLVKNNLFKLRGRTVMLRIPDLNNDLLKLLGELLQNTTLIILANPEQKQKLYKQYRFRQLTSRIFPKTTNSFLFQMLASRVRDTGMSVPPFSLEATMLASFFSQRNPGRFLEMLARALNQAELEGRTEQIDMEYALRVMADSLDEKAMTFIALSETKVVTRPGEVTAVIERRFGVRIEPRRVGELLRSLGLQPTGRDSKGWKYRITQPTIPLLGEASLTTQVNE